MSDINLMITNVSTINLKFEKTRHYKDEYGNQFEGTMTNEAPIKSVIKRLNDKNERLGVIVFIESEAVQKKFIEDKYKGMTHGDVLRKQIDEYVKREGIKRPDYVIIPIKNEPKKGDVSETVFQVYNKILEKAENKETDIYIESNGGVRYVLTMLLSVTKTLESCYTNIHIAEITSMVLTDDPVSIVNTKSIYDTAQITNIVDEFIDYGRINSLQRYINECMQELDNETWKDITGIIFELEKTCDDIQLCRTSLMLEDFYLEGGVLKKILQFEEKYEDNSIAEVLIFKYILEVIRKEFEISVYKDVDLNTSNSIVYLPKMIRWCLDKNFIQQALTLCAEKLPNYLVESKRLNLSEELQNILDSSKTNGYEKYYYFVTHLGEFKLYAPKVNAVLESVRECGDVENLFGNIEWNEIFIDSKLSINVVDEEIKEITNDIVRFVSEYNNLPEDQMLDQSRLEQLLTMNGFKESVLDEKIKISNKYAGTIFSVLNGKYLDEGEMKEHLSLGTKKERIKKVLPKLAEFKVARDKNIDQYDKMIDQLFHEDADKSKKLKEKYSKKQSNKFYIMDALQTGHISSNMSAEKIQDLLYLYSICKEQRNLSNHAQVSEDDACIAMNSLELKRVINKVLCECE